MDAVDLESVTQRYRMTAQEAAERFGGFYSGDVIVERTYRIARDGERAEAVFLPDGAPKKGIGIVTDAITIAPLQ